MNEEELKERTKRFALRIIKLVDSLPKTTVRRTIGNQLVRCGTTVGANYRSACRGRSKADFIYKLGIVVEEADESEFCLKLLIDGKIIKRELVEPLLKEAGELTAIFISSVNTAKKRNR
tara:strand:+ start:5757 stop:6113 length:357 start_codon:yes stop_codon:yes gene_type:complete